MLQICELEAGYGQYRVLHGISLHVDEGEFVALLGANGAGKTTLMRAVTGLIPKAAGSVLLDGRPLADDPADIVQSGLVLVPEGRMVFPRMSVRENLLMGATVPRAHAARTRQLEMVLSIFPRLGERYAQLAATMSGGEQQMLAIGRALMSLPRMLMLDEPSLGLSPIMVQETFAVLKQLHASGLSLLLIEQNVVASLEMADRAYVLENGRITLEGGHAELMGNDRLRQAYLGL